MTLDDLLTLAQDRLLAQGHLLHSQLLHIVNGDESLLEAIRDRLIEDGRVVDKFGVALVASEAVAVQMKNKSSTQSPSLRSTVENLSALVESHATLPVVQDGHSESADLEPKGDRDLSTARLKSLWDVAATGSQQVIVSTTCQPSSEASVTGIDPASDWRPTKGRMVYPPSHFIEADRHDVVSETSGKDKPSQVRSPLSQPRPSRSATVVLGGTLRYVLWNAGRESGPFPREEIEQRLAEGRLKPTDFVRIDTEDEWIPASKALVRTAKASNSTSDQKPAVGTRTPTEEIAAATALSVAVSVAARQAARAHSQRHLVPASRSQSVDGNWSTQAGWNFLKQHCAGGRLQNGAAILMIAIVILAWWNWPAASRTISEEFIQYRVRLEALDALHGSNPSSPQWQQFVAKHRPRIEKLVTSLKPRANAKYPADRELFWAGERGLLPMLDEGLQGRSRKHFDLHLHQALQILDGDAAASQVSPHAGAHGLPRTKSATPVSPNAPVTRTITNTALPHGAPISVPRTSPHAPLNNPVR